MKSKALGWIAAAVLMWPMAANASPIPVNTSWIFIGDSTPLVAMQWHLPNSDFAWSGTPLGDLTLCNFCIGTLFADHGWSVMATSNPLDRTIGGPAIFLGQAF